MSDLTEKDLTEGGLYRAKNPRKCANGEFNDRVILWRSNTRVQYDSYAVANGRKYPEIGIDQFLKWAGHRINEDGSPWEKPDA